MAGLDFCVKCGSWVGANEGTIRLGLDGEPEIICKTCLAVDRGRLSMDNKVKITELQPGMLLYEPVRRKERILAAVGAYMNGKRGRKGIRRPCRRHNGHQTYSKGRG